MDNQSVSFHPSVSCFRLYGGDFFSYGITKVSFSIKKHHNQCVEWLCIEECRFLTYPFEEIGRLEINLVGNIKIQITW